MLRIRPFPTGSLRPGIHALETARTSGLGSRFGRRCTGTSTLNPLRVFLWCIFLRGGEIAVATARTERLRDGT